ASKPARASGVLTLIPGISEYVGDMTDGRRPNGTSRDSFRIAWHWVDAPHCLHAFLRHTVDRNQADLVTIDHRNHANFCITQFLRALANCLEYRFQIVERS